MADKLCVQHVTGLGFVIPEATELPIRFGTKRAPLAASSNQLYRIAGSPGIWMRVARDGRSGLIAANPNMLVSENGCFLEVRRCVELETSCGIGGQCELPAEDDLASDPEPARDDSGSAAGPDVQTKRARKSK